MKQLVESNKQGIWTDSKIVADKFGIKHAYFIDVIKKVCLDYPDIRVGDTDPCIEEKFYKEDRSYRGNSYTVYLMNKQFFSLAAMRMTSKKARTWQRRFISAFFVMETAHETAQTNKSDIEWTQTRQIGKTARIEETDAIQKFVEYATNQGSTKAKFYYKHITNATYKALGLMSQKNPKLRDQMNIYQVSELMLAERLAKIKLLEYMDLGRNYKDIYESIKHDLIHFSNAIRIDAR